MIRSSRGDAAGRAFRGLTRGTVEKVNDGPKMQEIDVNLLQDEKKQGVERWQNYGFSSVPLGPTAKKYAEALIGFLGGNRSHGVVLGIDDRRHRPKNMKSGESVQYDDQGQQVHLSREGIRIKGGEKQLPVHVDIGDTHAEFTKEQVIIKAGGNTLKLNKDGLFCNDHKIDNTHKHTDVMPGAGRSGPPE